MNLKTELLGDYQPRASVYPKTNAKGIKEFYINYYLPGRKKRVGRFLSRSKTEAKKLMRLKETKLMRFEFDDFDLSRIPEGYLNNLRKPRITLDEALDRYMMVTSYNRRAQTNKNTYSVIKTHMVKLGCIFVDEVTPEKAHRMVGMLKSEGLSDATILSYVIHFRSFFKSLIEIIQLVDIDNPFKTVKTPPKSSKISSRVARKEDIAKILQVERLSCREGVPIIPLVRFLIYTGCRLGEAIHAEWEDFDLEKGIWNIRIKSECPTLRNEGWAPKNKKPRVIPLDDRALEVLESLPRYEKTWGSVRDEGKTVYRRGNFIFTSRKKVEIDGVKAFRQLRIVNQKRAWENLLKEAGVQDMQIKDIRSYFNSVLINDLQFSHKQAGAYVGNSELVNHAHYTTVSLDEMIPKLKAGKDVWIQPGM